MRRGYSKEFKIAVLDDLNTNNYSLRYAATKYNINPSMISRWRNKECLLKSSSTPKKSKKLGSGRKSATIDIEEDIDRWLEKCQNESRPASRKHLIRYCKRMYPEYFDTKSVVAINRWCDRFLKRSSFSIRKVNSTSNITLANQENLRQLFATRVRKTLRNLFHENERDSLPHRIFNMDQLATFYLEREEKVIVKKGTKRVVQCLPSSQIKSRNSGRVSVFLTASLQGEKIRPHIVFKGQPDGYICKHEFISFPKSCTYSCQEKGWTTVEVMKEYITKNWVDVVIDKTIQYESNVVLLIDSLKAHKNKEVLQLFQDHCTYVIHVDPGLTCVSQPLYVGMKPFRDKLHEAWDVFLYETEESILEEMNAKQWRKKLVEIVAISWEKVSTETIQNEFKKAGSFLPFD